MIDYEKLAVIHDLAKKNSIKNGHNPVVVSIAFDSVGNEYVSMDYWVGHEKMYMSNVPENMNFFIERLKELNMDDSKYKVGQKVWHINDEDEICSFEISKVDRTADGYVYENDEVINPEWWLEEQLYLSKIHLIEHHFDYWTKLFLAEADKMICDKGVEELGND